MANVVMGRAQMLLEIIEEVAVSRGASEAFGWDLNARDFRCERAGEEQCGVTTVAECLGEVDGVALGAAARWVGMEDDEGNVQIDANLADRDAGVAPAATHV